MKKKTLSLILAATLSLIALSACGSSQESKAPEDTKAESQNAAATEEATPTPDDQQEEEGLPDLTGQSLHIYCGAGMQQAFQEISDNFKEATGCEMNVTFANAAQIQTQINESQEGDFFIAGSAEEVKPVSDHVSSSTDLVKHIPVLAVAEGNPKGITGIKDLGSDELVTVIGDPESTPIGKIATKAFADFGVTDTVNLGATTTTAPQLATVIGLSEADAAIIWKENCNAEGVEICDTPDMDAYVKTIPAARLSFNRESEAADVFTEYLATEEAGAVWTSYGYELLS